jgi:hypothetical protein
MVQLEATLRPSTWTKSCCSTGSKARSRQQQPPQHQPATAAPPAALLHRLMHRSCLWDALMLGRLSVSTGQQHSTMHDCGWDFATHQTCDLYKSHLLGELGVHDVCCWRSSWSYQMLAGCRGRTSHELRICCVTASVQPAAA